MSRLASKPCVHCHSPAPFPLIHPPSLHHPFVRTIIRASLICVHIYIYMCVWARARVYICICIYGSYTGIIRVLYSWGLSLAVASVCVLARVHGCVRVALCACSQILCRLGLGSLLSLGGAHRAPLFVMQVRT